MAGFAAAGGAGAGGRSLGSAAASAIFRPRPTSGGAGERRSPARLGSARQRSETGAAVRGSGAAREHGARSGLRGEPSAGPAERGALRAEVAAGAGAASGRAGPLAAGRGACGLA